MDVTIFEILFSGIYVIIMWIIVLNMNDTVNKAYKYAFYSLMVGDIFHLGTRVLSVMGDYNLIYVGDIVTAIAFTSFTFFMLFVWGNTNYQSKYDTWIVLICMILILIRCVLLYSPFNNWGQYDFACIIRNTPLIVTQFIIGYMMIVDNDKLFNTLGKLMVFAATLYAIVILLLESYPMIGMLMIPKTTAYLLMAYFIKKHYERKIT